MKKDAAYYLIFSLRQIILIIHSLLSIFVFLPMVFSAIEWYAPYLIILIGLACILIYDRLNKINGETNNKLKKVLLVFVAFVGTIILLICEVVWIVGVALLEWRQ